LLNSEDIPNRGYLYFTTSSFLAFDITAQQTPYFGVKNYLHLFCKQCNMSSR
jgi:hypothetical protein